MSSFSITFIERQVLFRKYIQLGNNYEEADQKIKTFCEYLHALKIKLKKRNISDNDINLRFKKEFEKLCQSLEGGIEYLDNINKGARRFKRY